MRAWNHPGHMVSGALAYYALKAQHPARVPQVVALLKQYPWYAGRWQGWIAALPAQNGEDPAEKEALALFMLAARWPDDARSTPFDCPECHYVDFPYSTPFEPVSVVGRIDTPPDLLNAFACRVVDFAFCHLLNFRLMPRLKAIHKQKLYRPDAGNPDAFPYLQTALTRPINWALIEWHYNEMVKFATALKLRRFAV